MPRILKTLIFDESRFSSPPNAQVQISSHVDAKGKLRRAMEITTNAPSTDYTVNIPHEYNARINTAEDGEFSLYLTKQGEGGTAVIKATVIDNATGDYFEQSEFGFRSFVEPGLRMGHGIKKSQKEVEAGQMSSNQFRELVLAYDRNDNERTADFLSSKIPYIHADRAFFIFLGRAIARASLRDTYLLNAELIGSPTNDQVGKPEEPTRQ